MYKKICFTVIAVLLAGNVWAASAGLIVVLSSLSSTALTAVNAFTENVLWKSSRLERMKEFVEENDPLLAADISRARGGTLDALAEIAEVPTPKRDDFFVLLKDNYSVLYPAAETAPEYRAQTILEITELL
ncbi:MAG: DUF3015 family protein [Spirochaetota bacterium]